MAWLAIFAIFTAFGLFNFEYRYLDDLARDRHDTLALRLFEEMTGAYIGFALFPLILRLVRRFRIRRANWWFNVPLNLLALAMISIIDTTLMGLCRKALSPLFGLGEYDYGNMLYRYPMEFSKHVPLFLVAVGAIYVADSYREARDRQVAHADLEARLAEAQLENLRLQLEPHFLFNALNTISAVMHEDIDRADAMLARLGDLLRRTLSQSSAQQVPLEEELELLRNYVSIMQARFGDSLRIDYDVDPLLSKAMVPPLILQPLVENSIRHGRGAPDMALMVKIRVHRDLRDVERLVLQVEDNGPGIHEINQQRWRKGVGLSNTEERLQNLYGEEQEMALENAQGLRVTITFPIRWKA